MGISTGIVGFSLAGCALLALIGPPATSALDEIDRPHSGLDYRTPKEVRQTWEDAQEETEVLRNQAA